MISCQFKKKPIRLWIIPDTISDCGSYLIPIMCQSNFQYILKSLVFVKILQITSVIFVGSCMCLNY